MSKLLYIEKIPFAQQVAFTTRVEQIAAALGISNPNWLMQVMYAESKVNPAAYNPNGGASGLIQFMPSTAKALGTTTAAIRSMTAVQQLDYVYKYFKPYNGKLKSYFDVYLVVFFPAAIGKADDWVIRSANLSAEVIAKANPAINIIKDGKITIAEFKQYLVKTVPLQFRDIVFKAATAAGTTLLLLAAFFF